MLFLAQCTHGRRDVGTYVVSAPPSEARAFSRSKKKCHPVFEIISEYFWIGEAVTDGSKSGWCFLPL